MTSTLWLIVLAGALSIVYGIVTTRGLLAADAGSARMQEISAAVREGAAAYLKRQYQTIAMVGVVIFVIAWLSARGLFGHGLSDWCRAVGCGGLYRHERLGARQRPRGAGRNEVPCRRFGPRVQVWRGNRPSCGRPRPSRRYNLFRLPHWLHGF